MKVEIKDVFVGLGLLGTTLGLIFNFIQLRRNWRVQKSQFLANIFKDFSQDGDVLKQFYKVNYDQFIFNASEFQGTDEERHIDALLGRYNYLGMLCRKGLLEIKDLEFFAFDIAIIFKNAEIIKYLTWLDKQYKEHGIIGYNKRRRAFDDARWLVEQLSLHNRLS